MQDARLTQDTRLMPRMLNQEQRLFKVQISSLEPRSTTPQSLRKTPPTSQFPFLIAQEILPPNIKASCSLCFYCCSAATTPPTPQALHLKLLKNLILFLLAFRRTPNHRHNAPLHPRPHPHPQHYHPNPHLRQSQLQATTRAYSKNSQLRRRPHLPDHHAGGQPQRANAFRT